MKPTTKVVVGHGRAIQERIVTARVAIGVDACNSPCDELVKRKMRARCHPKGDPERRPHQTKCKIVQDDGRMIEAFGGLNSNRKKIVCTCIIMYVIVPFSLPLGGLTVA